METVLGRHTSCLVQLVQGGAEQAGQGVGESFPHNVDVLSRHLWQEPRRDRGTWRSALHWIARSRGPPEALGEREGKFLDSVGGEHFSKRPGQQLVVLPILAAPQVCRVHRGELEVRVQLS